mmetsp:Transcript_8160/g.12107  ORF Transcript_8160/g.12107 Transcript_8160/m.12107 type:complete len:399 (+) Transcript_8160:1737-2933(+)
MNLKRRIDNSRTPGQIQNLSIPQKHKDTLAQQLPPHTLHKIPRTQIIILVFFNARQPWRTKNRIATLLAGVSPVRGHTILCYAVHRTGSNLHLNHLTTKHNRSVNRLIPVRFGERYVIFDAGGDRLTSWQILNEAQHVIAQPHAPISRRRRSSRRCHAAAVLILLQQHKCIIILFIQNHAQGNHIGNVIQIMIVLRLHLMPQRVQLFGTSGHCKAHLLFFEGRIRRQSLLQNGLRFVQRIAKSRLIHAQSTVQLLILFRKQVQKRRILELALELPYAHAMGQRRKNIQRLPTDLDLLLRLHVTQCAHIVQPICQLDDDDAIIIRHGHKHLTQILRLFIGVIRERNLGQLADLGLALHNAHDHGTEERLDLRKGKLGIFHRIVQQTSHDGLRIHLQPRQ